MIVMGLDPSSIVGWAVFDTKQEPSTMLCGSIRCTGDIMAKLVTLSINLPALLDDPRPDFVAIEAPPNYAKQYIKKPRIDLLTGIELPPKEEKTIKPDVLAELGQLAGGVTETVMLQKITCVQVPPITWQSCIDRGIRARYGKGEAKKATKDFCDRLRISANNEHERDAAIIAFWAAGYVQHTRNIV